MSTHVNAPHGTTAQQFRAATDKQRVLIEKLLAEKDLTGTAYENWTPEWNKATTKGASTAINFLLTLPKAAKVTEAPKVDFSGIPESHYAIVDDGITQFFRVIIGKKKWDGYRFVERLIGAPGDWRKVKVPPAQSAHILARIDSDKFNDVGEWSDGEDNWLEGPKAAAVRYSRRFTCCAACNAPLSDPDSITRGLGPVCAARY